jgi:hypothetical protein
MSPKDEEFIRFYRDAVIAGHNEPDAAAHWSWLTHWLRACIRMLLRSPAGL